jgi:hypothetical protein
VREQITQAFVGFFGGAQADDLAPGPFPVPVAERAHSTGVGVLTGKTDSLL